MASVDTNMLAMLSGPESPPKRQRVAQFGVADLSTQTDASVNASEPTQIDSCEKEDDAASRSSASSPLMSIRGRRITIDRITDVVASWSDGDTEEDSRDAYVSHSIEAPASAASSPLINTRERRISLDRIEEVVASWSDRDTEDESSAAHVAVRDSAGERAFGNALDSIKAPAVFRDSWIFRPDPGIMLRRQGEARAAVTGNADEGASESDEAAVDVSSSDPETEEADEVHLGGLCDNVDIKHASLALNKNLRKIFANRSRVTAASSRRRFSIWKYIKEYNTYDGIWKRRLFPAATMLY
jgi:hypothetical protein